MGHGGFTYVNLEAPRRDADKTPDKFEHPDWTAKGEQRASVPLRALDTLWINTGTLCNIECASCYILSSPRNDALVYISASEVRALLDEVRDLGLGTREIGYTGGEPFMNPDMIEILETTLERGHETLVLTNAMQPMQRPRVQDGLLALKACHGANLVLRVSLDHYGPVLHEKERGTGTWDKAIAGIDWLAANGFRIAIAGRTCWGEVEQESRAGYARLIAERGWPIDPADPHALVLLPEMDEGAEVPEITTACWDILGRTPDDIVCANSRMVVKRKGREAPTVVPCTLLPYDERFDMGQTLAQSLQANTGMFEDGAVKLCHPHCAKFCVLGGGSCS